MSQLAELDRAEIERSATQTARITVKSSMRGQVLRYLNPPSDTSFPLEYAFSLPGEVRRNTELDVGCGAARNPMPLVETYPSATAKTLHRHSVFVPKAA
jgi:hypothetical protein